MNVVNEETIIPEVVEDALVTDEVETVEAEVADAQPDETEETDNGEVTAESEEAEPPEESSPSKQDGIDKRIGEVTNKYRVEERARISAESERDYWRNQAQQNQVAPEPVEAGKTLADFEYDEGKFADYLTAQAKSEAKAEADRTVQHERTASLQADFSGREADFSKDIDDYHAATSNPALDFSPDMADATLHAEQGPALRYYLAKNPEVSAKLARMHPFDMARELGRIEATKLGKKEPPSVTKAPKPVPKIVGTDSKSPIKIDDPKISDSQFRKLREKQIANR